MTAILTAAFVMGGIAPWIRAISWRVPFSFLSVRMVLLSSLMTTGFVLVLGLIIELFIPEDASLMGYKSALIAGVAVLTLTVIRERRSRHLRGAFLLAQRCSEPDAQKVAVARLVRNFERDFRSRRKSSDVASEVFVVLTPLTTSGLWQTAIRLLEGIDESRLSTKHQALRAQSLATCLIRAGRVEEAQEVLSQAPASKAEDRAIERWNQSLEALLAAVEGDTGRAEALLERARDGGDDASLELSQALVEAHVLASKKQESEAENKLRSVLDALGPGALDQALEPRGPASPIAERLLEEVSSG